MMMDRVMATLNPSGLLLSSSWTMLLMASDEINDATYTKN